MWSVSVAKILWGEGEQEEGVTSASGMGKGMGKALAFAKGDRGPQPPFFK